jgi:hypothetical protein
LWRKRFSRRNRVVVVTFAFLVSLLLAFVSIWNVWTPYLGSLDDRIRNTSEGHFPQSKLSYPLYLNVYHTPFEHRQFDDRSISGNVSFSVLIADAKVMEVDGTFHYLSVPVLIADAKVMEVDGTFSYAAGFYGSMPLQYSLDFPIRNQESFFIFLLILFTLFNIMGALIGIVSTRTLAKRFFGKPSHEG